MEKAGGDGPQTGKSVGQSRKKSEGHHENRAGKNVKEKRSPGRGGEVREFVL